MCFDAYMMWSWREGLLYRDNVADVEVDLDELYFFLLTMFFCVLVCVYAYMMRSLRKGLLRIGAIWLMWKSI